MRVRPTPVVGLPATPVDLHQGLGFGSPLNVEFDQRLTGDAIDVFRARSPLAFGEEPDERMMTAAVQHLARDIQASGGGLRYGASVPRAASPLRWATANDLFGDAAADDDEHSASQQARTAALIEQMAAEGRRAFQPAAAAAAAAPGSCPPLLLRLIFETCVCAAAVAAAAAAVPVFAPGPRAVAQPQRARGLDIDKHSRRLTQIRAMLGSHESNFMTHIGDPAIVASMVDAFAASPYNARVVHAELQQTPVNGDALRGEPRWIDHAFWVARQFFTEQLFPNGVHLQLTQAFFILSLRLYLGKDGLSSRLIATTAAVARDAGSSAYTVRTRPRPQNGKRALYHRNNYLPISMPADTEFELSALPVQWPAAVRVDDLWEHDMCAILTLSPEFSAGMSVVRPNQPAIHAAQPYMKLLYTSTYWPAVATATSNDAMAVQQQPPSVCVLVDECVRKLCTMRSMVYDALTYEISNRTNAYWPTEEAPPAAPEDADRRRPKQRVSCFRRKDQGGLQDASERRVRRRLDASTDDEGAEAAAPGAPRRAANQAPQARRWAFNSCRRTDGREFWMQPFAKFRDTSRNANPPPRIAAELNAQAAEGYGQGRVPQRHDADSLAMLYPEMYMEPEARLTVVRRASAALRADIVGEVLRLKTAHFQETLLLQNNMQ